MAADKDSNVTRRYTQGRRPPGWPDGAGEGVWLDKNSGPRPEGDARGVQARGRLAGWRGVSQGRICRSCEGKVSMEYGSRVHVRGKVWEAG